MQIAKVANNEQQNYNEEIALSEFSYDDKGRLVQNLLCNRQDTMIKRLYIYLKIVISHMTLVILEIFYGDMRWHH